MGKKIIFKGADFSENAIVVNLLMKIKAGESFTYNGVTYSGGTDGAYYELEDVPTTFGDISTQNYLQEVKIGKPYIELDAQYFMNQASLEKVIFGKDVYFGGQSYNMFKGCTALTTIIGNPDISHSTNISGLFSNCSSLINLNISSWNSQSANAMNQIFASCSSLKTLNISSFSTANTTSAQRMFNGCENLETLTLGTNFNLNKTIDVTDMFWHCDKLSSIIAPGCVASEYNTPNTQMYALVNAITSSGFAYARQLKSLVITCNNGGILTGTYIHDTGWSWSLN